MPKRSDSYFSIIDENILDMIEVGSPQSIRQALYKIRKSPLEYLDKEKTLIYVATSIMQLAWPFEQFAFDTPQIDTQDLYTSAIISCKNGVYDEGIDNKEFLSYVLPSLLLFTVKSKTDYFDIAKQNLHKALSINPNSILALYMCATIEYREANFQESIRLLEKADNMNPNIYEIQKLLAQSYSASEKYNDFFVIAKKAISLNPNDIDMLKLYAITAYNANQLDIAQEYAGRVLQKQSNDLESIRLRAKIYIEEDDYIRAAALLDMHSRSDKTNAEYLILRAILQKDWNHNNIAATATLETALKLYPDNIEVLKLCATSANEMNTKIAGKTSVEISDMILQKKSNDITALRIKVIGYMKQNNMTSAYNTNIQIISSKDVQIQDQLRQVDICLATGRKDIAFNTARHLYSEDSKNEEVIKAYIKVLVAQRNYPQANAIISEALPTASSALKSFFYYEKSFFVTDEEQVLSSLRASLTSNPRNRDALYRMYKVYFDKKDYRKAQYYLKQVVSLDPTDTQMLNLNAQLDSLLKR